MSVSGSAGGVYSPKCLEEEFSKPVTRTSRIHRGFIALCYQKAVGEAATKGSEVMHGFLHTIGHKLIHQVPRVVHLGVHKYGEHRREAGPMATPAARRKAEELGVNLSQVDGTGLLRVITPEDVARTHLQYQPMATPTATILADALRGGTPSGTPSIWCSALGLYLRFRLGSIPRVAPPHHFQPIHIWRRGGSIFMALDSSRQP
jgi:hypothetical protein